MVRLPQKADVWLFNLRDEWQIAEEPFMKYRYHAPEEAFMIMCAWVRG
jgi:hypothetical protein